MVAHWPTVSLPLGIFTVCYQKSFVSIHGGPLAHRLTDISVINNLPHISFKFGLIMWPTGPQAHFYIVLQSNNLSRCEAVAQWATKRCQELMQQKQKLPLLFVIQDLVSLWASGPLRIDTRIIYLQAVYNENSGPVGHHELEMNLYNCYMLDV